jgi:dTDP-4-amino-4,6-dideoxygalactose transaminase
VGARRRLAVLGGSPRFDEVLHVGRPNIGDPQRFLALAEEVLGRRWLTNDGPLVHRLEARLAELLDVPHCVLTCNGTVALEIALRASGVTGEAIVPAFTFIGTAHALQWQNITPVFCDVDPLTHNLDPTKVEKLITPRTSAIVGVHLWGRPCDVEALQDIADRHGLTMMYDAAHAFAAARNGRKVGGFGDAEIFSFHATKFFNTFEGGAITTRDDDLAARARLMRNFGFADLDEVVDVGTNGKMTEICAAMGLAGLDGLDDVLAVNRRNFAAYAARLSALTGLTVIDQDLSGESNSQYVVVEIDATTAGLSRDQLVDVLWAENVRARRYFTPGCHRMEPYRSRNQGTGRRLPVTERLADTVLVLPTGTAVDPEAIDAVCDIIETAQMQTPAVSRALSARGSDG